MNQYTELLEFIKTLGEADSLLNTITQDEPDKLDLDKSNIFPLLHISVVGGQFTNGSTIIFNIELRCLNTRETVKTPNTDKFWRNDNEVDNMNNTLAILNRIWNSMYKNFQENDITSSENPTLTPIIYDYTNVLDGWLLSFDVELPNTTISLCP